MDFEYLFVGVGNQPMAGWKIRKAEKALFSGKPDEEDVWTLAGSGQWSVAGVCRIGIRNNLPIKMSFILKESKKLIAEKLKFQNCYSRMTEKQIRNWLEKKITGYIWKIKGENSYGSRKKLETILKDILEILVEFEIHFLRMKR